MGKENESPGGRGALDIAHSQFSYIAGHPLCAQLSKKAWKLKRWASGPPQAYSLVFGDRVAMKKINNFSQSKMRLGNGG